MIMVMNEYNGVGRAMNYSSKFILSCFEQNYIIHLKFQKILSEKFRIFGHFFYCEMIIHY